MLAHPPFQLGRTAPGNGDIGHQEWAQFHWQRGLSVEREQEYVHQCSMSLLGAKLSLRLHQSHFLQRKQVVILSAIQFSLGQVFFTFRATDYPSSTLSQIGE